MALDEKKGILGISLVDDQLRVVEGRKQNGEFQIAQLTQGRTRLPLNFEVFADKTMARRFAEDITRLCETQEFSVKRVAFSLDSQMVLVKKMPVDQLLKDKELGDQINWEVRQFAISPADEYIVDFEAMNTNSDRPERDMLVVVVRKKIVQFLRQVFKLTNLELRVIDVDIFSAQRALQLNYDYSSSDKIGLIDVEERKVYFSILRDRSFFLAQDVDIPSGQSRDEEGEATARLISKELRRIILDQQLGRGVEDLNEIFLYGEAVEDSLVEGLQNSYDVRIDRADPFKRVKLLAKAKEALGESRTERFMVSVGAALRGLQ